MLDKHNHPGDHVDPTVKLDNVDRHLQTQAIQLLGDPHLMAAVTGSHKHMSAHDAAAWGLTGFALVGHENTPAQNQAAIAKGNDVASRVMNTTVATEADVNAALSAYGDINGGFLDKEGSYAQANLAGAISHAQNRLDLQRLASTNGTGDNAYTIQTQFASPADYQAFVKQQADLKSKPDNANDTRSVSLASTEVFDRKVVSTVGNSTKDAVTGTASYLEANGEKKELPKPIAA
ncbi:MAG TPA: hypothetical protein V6C89_10510 [Drouetiella sp.]|jgi:hypothetical protein